jgi:hypothetical protein
MGKTLQRRRNYGISVYSVIFYRAQASQKKRKKIVGPGNAVEGTGVKINAGSAASRVLDIR